MNLKAVIFDWAGTAVDFGCCAPAGVFVEVFKRHGIDITMPQAREPMGLHKRDHVAAVMAMPAIAAAWRKVHGADPSDSDVEVLYQEAVPLQIECLPDYAEPIPGLLETVDAIRDRGIAIGSTTGYIRDMLDVLVKASARQGYRPDVHVSADEVPQGRPAPFMCWEAAMRLQAWPAGACVKVGDTVPDIAAGRNAGMWTVAIAATGNEVGLTEAQFNEVPFSERRMLVGRARKRLRAAGADLVIDSVAQLMPCIDDLSRRIARGSRP